PLRGDPPRRSVRRRRRESPGSRVVADPGLLTPRGAVACRGIRSPLTVAGPPQILTGFLGPPSPCRRSSFHRPAGRVRAAPPPRPVHDRHRAGAPGGTVRGPVPAVQPPCPGRSPTRRRRCRSLLCVFYATSP